METDQERVVGGCLKDMLLNLHPVYILQIYIFITPGRLQPIYILQVYIFIKPERLQPVYIPQIYIFITPERLQPVYIPQIYIFITPERLQPVYIPQIYIFIISSTVILAADWSIAVGYWIVFHCFSLNGNVRIRISVLYPLSMFYPTSPWQLWDEK